MEKEKDKRKNMIDKKLKEEKYGIVQEEDDYVIKSIFFIFRFFRLSRGVET